jgi:uncharacterized membrane protein
MSARVEFLVSLRAGMRGASSQFIDEAVTDYTGHFDEGIRAGRSEAEIAKALGDPLALADELRLAAHAGAWQSTPNARTAAKLVNDAAGLGRVRKAVLYLLAPILVPALTFLCLAGIAGITGGLWFLFAGHDFGFHGGTPAVWLAGVGMISGGIAAIAVALLATIAAINALARRVGRPDRRANQKTQGVIT